VREVGDVQKSAFDLNLWPLEEALSEFEAIDEAQFENDFSL
jgi:hypothetical protein